MVTIGSQRVNAYKYSGPFGWREIWNGMLLYHCSNFEKKKKKKERMYGDEILIACYRRTKQRMTTFWL